LLSQFRTLVSQLVSQPLCVSDAYIALRALKQLLGPKLSREVTLQSLAQTTAINRPARSVPPWNGKPVSTLGQAQPILPAQGQVLAIATAPPSPHPTVKPTAPAASPTPPAPTGAPAPMAAAPGHPHAAAPSNTTPPVPQNPSPITLPTSPCKNLPPGLVYTYGRRVPSSNPSPKKPS
jgi:hypothetical protein